VYFPHSNVETVTKEYHITSQLYTKAWKEPWPSCGGTAPVLLSFSTIQYTGESLASHSGQFNPRKELGWAGIMTEQYLLEKQILNDSCQIK
jgi:hypothetical protein